MSTSTPQSTGTYQGRDPSYLRLLLVLLGTATFFEGYDAAINAVALSDLAQAFGVDLGDTSTLAGPMVVISLGAFGAVFVTMIGDRIGRKPLLILTTLTYALFTGLTAAAQTLTQFMIIQFIARTFLIAEYATAVTIITEEFPARRRGRAMGILTAVGALGLPTVAVLHLLLRNTTLGFRALYLVGIIPLVVVGLLRFKLQETQRWVEAREKGAHLERVPFSRVLKPPHRWSVMRVGLMYFFFHFALLGAMAWFPYYASIQRNLSDGALTLLLVAAYPLGLPGYLVAGSAQDRWGRRRTGTLFMFMGLLAGIGVFQSTGAVSIFVFLVIGVFFGLGVNPVLNAVAAELFPTEVRTTAVALARSFFGTAGAVLGPFLVGILADEGTAARFPGLPIVGDLGDVITVMGVFFIPAILLLRTLPETAGRELENIARAATAEVSS